MLGLQPECIELNIEVGEEVQVRLASSGQAAQPDFLSQVFVSPYLTLSL
jgi:hypothetical protein